MEVTAVVMFVALAWSGLQFGTLWIMQTSILPLIDSRTDQAYLDTCQGINMHFFHKIALSGGIAIMALGIYLTIQLDQSAAEICAALATLGMVGVGLISEGTNRPIWRRIEAWNIKTLATNWQQLRHVWSRAHTLRTVSAFLALSGFTAAAIIEYA